MAEVKTYSVYVRYENFVSTFSKATHVRKYGGEIVSISEYIKNPNPRPVALILEDGVVHLESLSVNICFLEETE